MNHARLDQLSDGIFSIVMTILVFNIKLPAIWGPIDNAGLWKEIETLLPVLLSYVLSFALIFTYWRAHHFFVSIYAKNVDSMLININGLFFMLISLVPFTASVLGQYNHNQLSVVIFGIHIVLIGLVLYWMRRYVLYSPHIQNPEIYQTRNPRQHHPHFGARLLRAGGNLALFLEHHRFARIIHFSGDFQFVFV